MHQSIRVVVGSALVFAALPALGQQARGGQAPPPLTAQQLAAQQDLPLARDPLDVRTFPLQHLSAGDAARLVAPYMQWKNTSVFDAGARVHAITVRAPKTTLATVDSLLRAYDRAPVTLVLHFKLIAAVDSTIHDLAIAEIDATLRSMFKFGGYRLASQSSATVNENSTYDLNLAYGGTGYTLTGSLGPATGAGSNMSQQLTVRLHGMVSRPDGRGNLYNQMVSIVSTGLTVPIGQTVVVGGSAGGGDGRTLILAIRAELAPGKR